MQKKGRGKRIREKGKKLIVAGVDSLRNEGLVRTAAKTLRFLKGAHPVSHQEWMSTPLYTEEQLRAQRSQKYDREILFSIITPLYNTPEDFLREMIGSVQKQTYPNWELCLADGSDEEHGTVGQICLACAEKDSRIKYRKLDSNKGIAGNSNAAIEMAAGEYLALLDHDDLLHPAALHDVMQAICGRDADLIYTDEATFRSPDVDDVLLVHFKPDYAPDNLRANNYICHFTAFRRALLDRCGAFRSGYDGAQDHDLMLRLTREAERIVHIPEVLYYWRASPQSTAESEGNKPFVSAVGIKAVTDNLLAMGIEAKVELAKGIPTIYRISYPLPSPAPKVSIIIPNRDHVNDLRECVRSIREKTAYANYEIIIVENNSVEAETFACYRELSTEERVSVIRWPGSGFNWSAINNYAVAEAATGDYLLLLNNDTEVISPDWIEEMLMYAQRPDVGAVGAMLYYPDDTIQHAGVVLGLGGAAGHAFNRIRRGNKGYMGRLCYAQNYSAVTGACLLIRRAVWEEVGGLDEAFAVNLNDIDLCMRIRKAGYLVVWTPYAELYHYESKSRGGNDTLEKKAGSTKEKLLFTTRWSEAMEKGDPYYNPNLTLKRSDFSPKNRKDEAP